VNLKRLPVFAFGLLVAATVGGFFLTAALKSANPLVYGRPQPTPAAFDPIHGRISSCISRKGVTLDYRSTSLKFQVGYSDSVGVYIVSAGNAGGAPVATLSSGTEMAKNSVGTFTWNGRYSDGQVAPDGTYYFKIVFQHQGRSADLSQSPVQVITTPARARVVSVRVVGTGNQKSTAPAVFSPPRGKLRIDFTPAPAGAPYRRVWIDIYRTDVTGKPQRAIQLPDKNPSSHTFTWNGEIDGDPAPAGTYLVGITAQNPACDQATWPPVMPPAPDTTPGAGVSIRYLTVTPPLTPTVSGSRASVAVYSPVAPFTWKLRRSDTAKVLAHGSGAAGDTHIDVPMPRHQAALYTLVVRSGRQSAAVPLVASKAGLAASKARVLVVLPMLTWIGNSPVDDSGDGLPDTLKAGNAVSLNRPLVDGPPVSLGDDAALLRYLNSEHRAYQLTTDVALAEDQGPSLVDRWGVLFPDGENFLPASLASANGPNGLVEFVKGGGRVLALGTGTFAATSKITGYPTDPRAAIPVKTKADLFGAERGPLTATDGALITELADDLHLFGGAVAFTGFSHYQPIEPPAGVHVSAAGIANGSPAIVAFPVGAGTVVEVGLPAFGASLAHDVDSQELLDNVWHLLAKR
jgi:flagellar hook assembly protein FlgD